MRTTAGNQWVWVFAGALPALALGAGCGDDTTATTTGTSQGGFGGFGGGDDGSSTATTGTPTTTTSGPTTTSQSNSASNSASQGTGGEGGGDGGAGPGPGSGGGGNGQGGSGPECGNDLLEDGEDCDGAELGAATCQDEGFFGGTIACNDDCTLDTSGCTDCGDGIADPGEDCDGDDLDGNDCTDIDDFVSGTLGCNDDCTFDTLQCVGAECNDGEVNGNEDCEVGQLGGRTCIDEGFVSGTLDCTNCQYDTTACVSCGDDNINETDICDGTDLGGQTCADVGNFTGGTLGCAVDCSAYDTSSCTNFPLPVLGELVITEIMINPNGAGAFPDNTAEWFEVTNPSVGTTYQLNGCEITSNNDGVFTVAGDFEIAPGESVTFAKSAPGFTADFTYPDSFAFSNSSADTVVLSCGGTEVDTVAFSTAAGFSVPNGATISLDPASTDATDNDDGANWCDATTIGAGFTSGDFGTPGEANPSCGAGALTIGFCRLQAPTSITDTEGTAYTVYGRVFVAGVTDVNQAGNDPNGLLVASLGYGDDGTDPATDPSWSFIAATPNAGYVTGSPGFEPNNDEYQASFNIPAAAGSPYDYAFRFSGDGGDTWTYCDTDGNAYAAAQAGQLTSNASAVDYNLYFSEYIEPPSGNGNNKVLEIYNPDNASRTLAGCSINEYRDGVSTVFATLALTGTIAANGTFVVCNSQETHVGVDGNGNDICNQRAGGPLAFTGNDGIELVCNAEVQDFIGQLGNDPGANGWGTGTLTTANRILRRNCAVTQGDTDSSNAFDPAAEWTAFTYDMLTMDDDLNQPYCP